MNEENLLKLIYSKNQENICLGGRILMNMEVAEIISFLEKHGTKHSWLDNGIAPLTKWVIPTGFDPGWKNSSHYFTKGDLIMYVGSGISLFRIISDWKFDSTAIVINLD